MVDGRASLTTKYISTFVTNSAMIIVLLYVSCQRNKKKCCKKKSQVLKVVTHFTVAEDFVDRRVAEKLVSEEF